MNKHILLVMKWLNDNDSVTQKELNDNRAADAAYAAADAAYAAADAAADAYAAADAAYAAADAAYAAADAAADAEKWVNKYFERTKENRQDYIDALNVNIKPVYTQAMASHNILPLVGMEVMSMGVNKIVRLPPDTNRRFLLESVEMGIYDLALIEGISAVTPPIELIDGKAYQFTNRFKKDLCGIYNNDKNTISVDQGQWFDVIAVTNIQLLEVK